MTCPICDQKPMNCDCTETERRQYAEAQELEEEVERLRLTDDERDAIRRAIDWLSALATTQENSGACAEDAATLRCLLLRTPKCAIH